jgi:hypothetical protein
MHRSLLVFLLVRKKIANCLVRHDSMSTTKEGAEKAQGFIRSPLRGRCLRLLQPVVACCLCIERFYH